MTTTSIDTSVSPLSLAQGGTNAITAQSAYINLLAINAINTTTVLSSYGQTVVCTGNADYTVTLPAASANKVIRFVFNTSNNHLVTLSPAAGTIQGQASVTYGPNEGCEIFSDGTNWLIISQQLQTINCLAFNSTTQSITNGTLIHFDTVLYDIGGFFDTVDFIYAPRYPGKYLITVALLFNSTSFTAGTCNNNILLNDITNYCLDILSVPVAGTNIQSASSALIPMNGTTDDIFIKTGTNQSGVSVLGAGSYDAGSCCTFSAVRISNF